MKTPLKKFTAFSQGLLPHEAVYIGNHQRFVDTEKRNITLRLVSNAVNPDKIQAFDERINKRKYSYIKQWINDKLEKLDVDRRTQWLLDLKQKIQLDAISAQEEKELLHYVVGYKSLEYNFMNLYDLAQEYRAYLLIRMRYQDHGILFDFLNTWQPHFLRAKDIQAKLYEATAEITDQYTLNNQETRYWEKWLLKVFHTETIDGKNRYQAFILLAFMYTNYQDHGKLAQLFEKIDQLFNQGQMYSRRILCNYYASRVLMHSKANDTAQAEYYAWLSIKHYNNDTIMYVNNLVAILLKNGKAKAAFSLMEAYNDLYKAIHNHHQRIGFCSYKIRVLSELGKNSLAESLAKNFLRTYKTQILKHRWHHFFTSYLNSLIAQEKYAEVLKTARKYHLDSLEKERRKKKNYVPNISWSISLSKYMEGLTPADKLLEEIKEPMQDLSPAPSQKSLMIQVMDKLSRNLPEAFSELKSQLLNA